jgi:hypothetical protein
VAPKQFHGWYVLATIDFAGDVPSGLRLCRRFEAVPVTKRDERMTGVEKEGGWYREGRSRISRPDEPLWSLVLPNRRQVASQAATRAHCAVEFGTWRGVAPSQPATRRVLSGARDHRQTAERHRTRRRATPQALPWCSGSDDRVQQRRTQCDRRLNRALVVASRRRRLTTWVWSRSLSSQPHRTVAPRWRSCSRRSCSAAGRTKLRKFRSA